MGIIFLPILLLASSHQMVKSGNVSEETPRPHQVLCDLGCICTEGQTVFLDCTRRNISKLPSMIKFAPETKIITFEENLFQNITRDTFLYVEKITELDLSHNKLNRIEDYSFRLFSSLTILHLSGNKFSNLSSKLLYGLSKLETLELGHNELEQMPDGFFVYTLSLQELKLQFNKLRYLPNNAFQFLDHLEKLDLGGNQLMAIPDGLFHFTPRLHSLSLSGNEFKQVPRLPLLKATYLHSLDLSSNKFEILPPGAFASLRNVSLLYLNELHQLLRVEKNAFLGMPKLKILSCSYNLKLDYFDPEAFGGKIFDRDDIYPKEQLILRRNALITLPEPQKIDTWSKLNHIDLSENPWRCDCKIRWMRKLKSNMADNVRCDSPFSLHGRKIVSLKEKEMVCEEHWMFTSIILITTSLIAFFICMSMVTVIICYSTEFGRSLRVKSQFSYRKFAPKKKESVDLDWDPTSLM